MSSESIPNEQLQFADEKLSTEINHLENNELESSDLNGRQRTKNKHRARVLRNTVQGKENVNFEESKEMMPHISSNITAILFDQIIKQLDFIPYNLIEVAYLDPKDQHPMILKLYPLNNSILYGKYKQVSTGRLPFPTMYWMSCPELSAKVAQLEVEGYIQIFNDRLHNSPETPSWLKQMEQAHQLYREERWKLLTPEDQIEIRDRKLAHALDEVGVAGMRNFHAVKCLHCHYAHYLGKPEHGNLIGQWVHELLQSRSSEI